MYPIVIHSSTGAPGPYCTENFTFEIKPKVPKA